MAKRRRPPAPQPTSESESIKTGAPSPPSDHRGTQSASQWIPSEEKRGFDVRINDGQPCLIVSYNPHELIKELQKYFSLVYLRFDVPLSLLVKPESPLAGLFTTWFAMGAATANSDSAKNKRRRATEGEIGTLLKSIADGVYDRGVPEKLLERLKDIIQGGNEEISKGAYGVGRWTTRAADYVAKHLGEKLQSALIQLALEAQAHALRASMEAQGLKKVNGAEQELVDLILATEQKLVKTRLRTRRPGGSHAKYDFSSLPEFYEKGREHFSKAKRVLEAVSDSSRQQARRVLCEACPDLDRDLIDRMIDKHEYLSSVSHLAAEWAGRQCGLPVDRGDEYPSTYLLQLLSRKKI
jgi:hypothetical protein